ncbi:MAG: hypothetical protein M1836_004479 [Candelina mexicana]|nr:MAG: hypothetical protein M1836_004479 [Candelina mexicana]
MKGIYFQTTLLLQAYLTLAAPSPKAELPAQDSVDPQPVYQAIVSAPGTPWDNTNLTLKHGPKGPILGYTPSAPPYLFVPVPTNDTGDGQILATYNGANQSAEYLTLAGPGHAKSILPTHRPKSHKWPAHYGVGWKGWKIANGTIVYHGDNQIGGGAVDPNSSWYAVEDGMGGYDLTYGTNADISALQKRWSWKKFFGVVVKAAQVLGPILLTG